MSGILRIPLTKLRETSQAQQYNVNAEILKLEKLVVEMRSQLNKRTSSPHHTELFLVPKWDEATQALSSYPRKTAYFLVVAL